MTRQGIHQGSHRTSRKARRSPRLSHLDPRGSFPPPDVWRTLRRTLAAAATTAGLCGLVAAPHAAEKGLAPVPPAIDDRGLDPVPPAAGAQALRGLVIGIDDYAPGPRGPGKLKGAVNDARDIHEALTEVGVEDLTVLLDGDATRERIRTEWRGLLERAEPGDTLVLTYAGHGSQEEPERVPGTERDGKDEVLILGGFRSTGDGTRERIIDDELNQWFLDAGRKELKVVFVADSCHSGTLTRAFDPRASALTYRYTRYPPITDDMLVLDLPEEAADTGEAGEDELAHVSFLAAGQEDETIPEIPVRDETGVSRMRGALSYMFARALRGEADVDGDGALRRDELWRFVRRNVRMMAEGRQTPNLLPNRRGDGDEIVLWLASPSSPDPESLPDHGVRLAVLHAGAGALARVREALAGVRIVPKEESPDLIWDAGAREVVTGMGDVAAHDVGLEALPGVIEKWKAVPAVRALSARNGLRMGIDPHDGTHRLGRRITVRIEGLAHPRLTVFSLSGNGRVHYLYPQSHDSAEVATDRPIELKAEVTPPFGADHVVAVSAGSSLDALIAALKRLDGREAAGRAVALLADAKARASGWSSGIQGLYTAP